MAGRHISGRVLKAFRRALYVNITEEDSGGHSD